MRCWGLVSTALVAIDMVGGAERPAVRTFDFFYAMDVEKDRDHMIDLIDRKTQAVRDCHGALLLALQGMARNG